MFETVLRIYFWLKRFLAQTKLLRCEAKCHKVEKQCWGACPCQGEEQTEPYVQKAGNSAIQLPEIFFWERNFGFWNVIYVFRSVIYVFGSVILVFGSVIYVFRSVLYVSGGVILVFGNVI